VDAFYPHWKHLITGDTQEARKKAPCMSDTTFAAHRAKRPFQIEKQGHPNQSFRVVLTGFHRRVYRPASDRADERDTFSPVILMQALQTETDIVSGRSQVPS
jgi:hypothetical protein